MREIGNIITSSECKEWVHNICNSIAEQITTILKKQKHFNLAISGGKTPKVIFEELIKNKIVDQTLWEKVNFFWVDERIVPINHPESNYGNALKFLSKLPAKFHKLYDENSGIESSIALYEKLLKELPIKNNCPRFDLILLGMGNDGHTASLFPNTNGLKEEKRLVFLNEIPQLQTSRITLSFQVIKNANQIFVLINNEKEEIFKEIQSKITTYPIENLITSNVNLTWFYHH